MATNYISSGDVLDTVAPSGGVVAGKGLQVGTAMFGVALNTAAEGEAVRIMTRGVFTMAKDSALAISIGDVVYWDSTNKTVDKTSSGQRAIGIAVSAASNPSDTVQVFIGIHTQAGT